MLIRPLRLRTGDEWMTYYPLRPIGWVLSPLTRPIGVLVVVVNILQ